MKKKLLFALPISIVIIGIILLKLFSQPYLFDQSKDKVTILSHTKNKFGPVWVYEQDLDEEKIRCMSFLKPPSDVNQSCMLPERPQISVFHYAQIFLSALFVKDNPDKMLMIGLGGATVPKALNILVPDAQLDIVEINSDIPKLVKKYFNFQSDDKNHIFIDDGFNFVKQSEANIYDIVFLDAFTPDYIPPSFLTDEFMQNIKKILKPDGIVLINTFAASKIKEKESALFIKHFEEYYNLSTDISRVILASKGQLPGLIKITKSSDAWYKNFEKVGVDAFTMGSMFRKTVTE